MDTPIFATAPRYNPGANTYSALNWGGWKASQQAACSVIPRAGEINNLLVKMKYAPGSGKARTFTLYVNGSSTALTATIADAAIVGGDTTHSVSVAAGDLVSIYQTVSGSPASSSMTFFACNFTGASNASLLLGDTGEVTLEAGTTQYACPGSADTTNGTRDSATGLVATGGTLSNLYISLSAAPGASQSAAFTLYKNGSATTLTATVSGASATTASDTTHSVSVAAGDALSIRIVTSASISSCTARWGIAFDPTTDGESIIMGCSLSNPDSSAANVNGLPISELATWGAVAVEVNKKSLMPKDAVIKNLYIAVPYAPGAGKSKAYNLRKNAADAALAVTISGTNKTGNDTSNTVSVVRGDHVNMQTTPTGTPTQGQVQMGVCIYIAPAVAASDTPMRMMMGIGS